MLKRCLAEGVGTAVLTLVACGVAVVADATGWWVATALAFGLVIVAMAYSIGNVSGCHINPAVSLAMLIRKELTFKEFALYVASQFIGALVGSFLLGLCLRGEFSSLGGNQIQVALMDLEVKPSYLEGEVVTATTNAMSYVSAFLVEVLLTFVFVLAIIGVTDKSKHDGKHAGIVIGLVLTLVHLFGLGFTGTSVNPARSFAPALLQAFAGNTTSFNQLWIWILAPFAGAALAAIVYTALTKNKQAK